MGCQVSHYNYKSEISQKLKKISIGNVIKIDCPSYMEKLQLKRNFCGDDYLRGVTEYIPNFDSNSKYVILDKISVCGSDMLYCVEIDNPTISSDTLGPPYVQIVKYDWYVDVSGKIFETNDIDGYTIKNVEILETLFDPLILKKKVYSDDIKHKILEFINKLYSRHVCNVIMPNWFSENCDFILKPVYESNKVVRLELIE